MIQEEDLSIQEELVDVAGMYVVQKILKKKSISKNSITTVYYYIRWKGYPNQQDHTWQPLENLQSVKQMVYEFQEKLKQQRQRQKKVNQENQKLLNNEVNVDSNKQLMNEKKKKKLIKINDDIKEQQRSKSREEQKNKQKAQKIRTQSKIAKMKEDEINNRFIQKQKKRQQLLEKKIQRESLMNRDLRSKMINVQKGQLKQNKRDTNLIKQQNNKTNIDQQKIDIKNKSEDKKITYGQTSNYIYQNGQLYYQMQVLNNKKLVAIQMIKNNIAKQHNIQSVIKFLQKFVIQLQERSTKTKQ